MPSDHLLFPFQPLEGLSETVPEPGQLPSQAAIPTSKATVPCYFYYNAYCIKGEQCPFLHEILPAQKFQKAAPEATIVHHPPETKASAGSDTRPTSIEVPANSPGDTLEVIKQEHSKEVIQQPAPGIASEEHSPSAESSVPDHEEPGIKLSDDNPLPPTEYVNGSPELCPGQGSDENAKDSAEADEWWESSPGFDVLVDDGSEQLAYEEDGDYLLAQERESEMLHGRLLQYDYEVPPGYDPLAYPDSGFLYEQGVYDGYDHADNKYNPEYFHKVSEHLSERRNLEPTSHRKRKPSRRRHDVVDDRDVMDLRDHLRKRRRTDRSPHKRYSSRTRGSSRERSGRRGMVPLLHGRLVSEVGNNMHVSAQSDTESALNDSHGKGWSGYPQSTRHAQSRLREREYRRRNRKPQLVLSSEVLPRSASRRTESSQIKSGAVTFSGPKTLAQIKEEKRRAREADGNSFESHTPQNFRRSRSIDFEGPKPLNELLKDKKRSGSSNGNENGLAGMSGEEQHSSGDKELRHSETLEKQNTGYESDFVDDDGEDEDEDEDEDALHEKLVRMLSS